MEYDAAYRFSVGTFECMAINDGMHPYTARQYFSNVTQDELEPELQKYGVDPERILSPFTCMLVNTGRNLVLVDTGAGNLTPSVGKIAHILDAEGIKPADIDTVILTHGHPDHIGGNTDSNGNPAFSKARHVMWKQEWDYWISDADHGPVNEPMVHIARKYLPPIQSLLDLIPIEQETEIVPGINALAAPGHTPGQMALRITSGPDQLLYISDVVLHPLHLEHPDWYPVYDYDHEQARTTKQRIFDQAASIQALVLAFHFYPYPSLGHVVKQGNGWRWQPINSTSL